MSAQAPSFTIALFGEPENALVGLCYLFNAGFVLGGTKLELIRVELFPWHAWMACKGFSERERVLALSRERGRPDCFQR